MKKLPFLFAFAAFFSCSKKDAAAPPPAVTYQIRVVAVDNNGDRSYTPVSRVKSGKVAVEFETADVADVKEYNVEVSTDGVLFKTVKTLAADAKEPNKLYSDTVVLP